MSELSVLGVSTEAVETMRAEFDEDGAVYVSDVCLLWADTNMIAESEHQFLDLALPYTLPIYLCTNYGTSRNIVSHIEDSPEGRGGEGRRLRPEGGKTEAQRADEGIRFFCFFLGTASPLDSSAAEIYVQCTT